MRKIKLKIVTPEKIVLTDEVSQVSVETKMGQITVLPGHLPLVAELEAGEIIVKQNEKKEDWMAVSGGFIEVLPNQVVILADTAEYAEDIDEKRAEEAKKKAQQILKEKIIDSEDYAMVAAKLRKELVRLKVVRRKKHLNKIN